MLYLKRDDIYSKLRECNSIPAFLFPYETGFKDSLAHLQKNPVKVLVAYENEQIKNNK